MSLLIEIPDTVARAIRLPRKEKQRQLKIELALSLYTQGMLSFGKAAELAEMTKAEFGLLLGQRNIPRQYDETDLEEDIAYASRQ